MESSTIQISDLDINVTTEQLEEIFSEFGPLKRCFAVRAKNKNASHTKGIVQFAISEDVDKLFQETNGDLKAENDLEFKFERIPDKKQEANNSISDQRTYDKKVSLEKKARLIVRNLSFKATDAKLKSYFTTYGEVVDVNILKKKDGKMVGCAFIQYSNVKEASTAIKELNGKEFLQRPVAIDWAVSKDRFQSENPKPPEKSEPEAVEKIDEVSDKAKVEAPTSEEKSATTRTNLQKLATDGDDSADDSEEDDNEDESGDDDHSDDEEGDEDDDDKSEPQTKKLKWEKGHDVNENKTVFVRNLSFNSDEEDLRDMMEENFGKVLFARFVMDRATERPKGTAFVKFASEESANKCMEASVVLTGANASKGKEGIFLDNRQIFVSMALKPDDVRTVQVENKTVKEEKEKKDSRNLYLANEGRVREGTQSAQGVSKTDLQLRVQFEKRKKDMLKDLNRFIDPTRLVIRNIPENITNPSLNKLIFKFCQPPRLKLKELKIMKDLKTGKSKGFAFVAFADHEMAINCLRKLNNNPEVFTNDQRPILEFSIENRKALNAREKRLEKSREKNPNFNKENVGKTKSKSPKAKQMKNGSKEATEDDTNEVKSKYMGSQSKVGQTQMPTHTGPKIRHKGPKISRKEIKKREKEMKNPKKRKAIKDSFQEKTNDTLVQQVKPEEIGNNSKTSTKKPKKKKVKKPKTNAQVKDIREDKNFNKMVTDYKQKLMAGNTTSKKRKWFDG